MVGVKTEDLFPLYLLAAGKAESPGSLCSPENQVFHQISTTGKRKWLTPSRLHPRHKLPSPEFLAIPSCGMRSPALPKVLRTGWLFLEEWSVDYWAINVAFFFINSSLLVSRRILELVSTFSLSFSTVHSLCWKIRDSEGSSQFMGCSLIIS